MDDLPFDAAGNEQTMAHASNHDPQYGTYQAESRRHYDVDMIRKIADPTEEVIDTFDTEPDYAFLRNPETSADEPVTFDDRDIVELLERGDEESFQLLYGALMDPETDMESKQEVLARIEELMEDDQELIQMLRRIVSDEEQPDDIRVQALSRLSDFGMQFVSIYQGHRNEEISSELDLLERLDLYLAQRR